MDTKTTTPAPAPAWTVSPLSQALLMLAGDASLQLDPGLQTVCRPLRVRTASPPSLADPFEGLHHSTWRPRGSLFFTLIKTADDTLVYCHENDTAYVAAPPAKLAHRCPAHTALLAQWCLDKGPDDAEGGGTPRLLIFDLIHADPSPARRGEMLRTLEGFIPRPLCVLQWAGHAAALDRFAGTLPHAVDYYLHLTEQPLQPERHLRVEIPPRELGAALKWGGDSP
jgi:hypothetical protein